MSIKAIHKDILSHVKTADNGEGFKSDENLEHLADNGHTHQYTYSSNKGHGKNLISHLKSKGWTISNHKTYEGALTGEGEYPGKTHRYTATKGDAKIHVSHAEGEHDDDTAGHYHELQVSDMPHHSIDHMRSIPTFGQFLQSTGKDKELAHAAGLVPKNKMN